jgi:hypothetical protein
MPQPSDPGPTLSKIGIVLAAVIGVPALLIVFTFNIAPAWTVERIIHIVSRPQSRRSKS